LFINPRPTVAILSDYYAGADSLKFWNDKVFPSSEKARRAGIFVPRAKKVAELCREHNARTNLLMDVGAGFGTFCEEIKKLSLFREVIAVEPAHELAETCRRKGIKVIEKPVEEVKLKEVSVITNFELIEHLFCPEDFLKSCAKILPKGGLLITTTPNVKGFDFLVMGKLTDNLGGPNHLNYFHIGSLSRLLKKCGFQVVESLTPGKLDAEIVRKRILDGTLNASKNRFLKYLLVDTWEENKDDFQRFLADNKLSSHMMIVAKKL
jgi:2-polyprenyl-3-methyl-5-hydroxy-6-metoxy-1,4-benzoquinol methylase